MKMELVASGDAVEDITFPAGKYVVIDPCCVFGENDDNWKIFCNLINNGDDNNVLKIDNALVPVFRTAYGDGGYPVFDVTTGYMKELGGIGVDAGLTALVPYKFFVNKKFNDKPLENLGLVVNINKSKIDLEDRWGNWKIDNIFVVTSGICEDCGLPCDGFFVCDDCNRIREEEEEEREEDECEN